jgi:hypothetical protein
VSAHPKYLASSKAKSRRPQTAKIDVPRVQRLLILIANPAQEELCNVLSSRTLLQVVRQGVHRLSVVIGNGAIGTIIADLRKPASTRRVSVRLSEMCRVLREPTTHAHGVAGQREDGDLRCGTGSLQRRQRVTAGDVDTLAHGTSSVTSSVIRPDAASAGSPAEKSAYYPLGTNHSVGKEFIGRRVCAATALGRPRPAANEQRNVSPLPPPSTTV